MLARPLQWMDAERGGARVVRVAPGLPDMGTDAVRLGQRRLATAVDHSAAFDLCCGCPAVSDAETVIGGDPAGAHLARRRSALFVDHRDTARAASDAGAQYPFPAIGGHMGTCGRPGWSCGREDAGTAPHLDRSGPDRTAPLPDTRLLRHLPLVDDPRSGQRAPDGVGVGAGWHGGFRSAVRGP